MQEHQGPDNCIKMDDLFCHVTGEHIIPYRRYDQTRIVRSLVKDLRREGCAIGNKAGKNGGYFLATTEEELEKTIKTLHSRALASLGQEAALKRVKVEHLLEQYRLEFNNQEKNDNG